MGGKPVEVEGRHPQIDERVEGQGGRPAVDGHERRNVRQQLHRLVVAVHDAAEEEGERKDGIDDLHGQRGGGIVVDVEQKPAHVEEYGRGFPHEKDGRVVVHEGAEEANREGSVAQYGVQQKGQARVVVGGVRHVKCEVAAGQGSQKNERVGGAGGAVNWSIVDERVE